MIGLKRGSVQLVPYNDNWKKLFEEEKAKLIEALGDLAIDIQHIGSTSIVGMMAKPIIDIDVGIKNVDNPRLVEQIVDSLRPFGYEWRRLNSTPDHHIFVKGPEDKRTHYLHVVEHKGQIWNNDVLFCDYLNIHETEAKAYENLKLALSEKYTDDREKYTKGKKFFINELLRKAQAGKP